jgi:hypothetical protein
MTTKTEDKPVVHFTGEACFFNWNEEPDLPVASVNALDHPVWGEDIVRTSLIVRKNDDGSFETLNTLYVPVETVALG